MTTSWGGDGLVRCARLTVLDAHGLYLTANPMKPFKGTELMFYNYQSFEALAVALLNLANEIRGLAADTMRRQLAEDLSGKPPTADRPTTEEGEPS